MLFLICTEWIKPICLPTAEHLLNDLNYEYNEFVASGWSRSPNGEKTCFQTPTSNLHLFHFLFQFSQVLCPPLN